MNVNSSLKTLSFGNKDIYSCEKRVNWGSDLLIRYVMGLSGSIKMFYKYFSKVEGLYNWIVKNIPIIYQSS